MYVYCGFPTFRRNGWRTCRSLFICRWFVLAHSSLTSTLVKLYHITENCCFLAIINGINSLYMITLSTERKLYFTNIIFFPTTMLLWRRQRCVPSLNVLKLSTFISTSKRECSAISPLDYCDIMFIGHCDYVHMGDNSDFLKRTPTRLRHWKVNN